MVPATPLISQQNPSSRRETEFPSGTTLTPPITGRGLVYVTGNNGCLSAQSFTSGRKKWDFPGANITPVGPILDTSAIYTGANLPGSGEILALDAQTGRPLWQVPAVGGNGNSEVQPGGGMHHELPLPGHGHPLPVATGRGHPGVTGLAESQMRRQAARPVRERGPEKRAGRKASTALRADLTRSRLPTWPCATPCCAAACCAQATGPAWNRKPGRC
jgi:hypothetical protein